MPSPEQILSSLAAIANQWWVLAAIWHVYFGALAAGLLLGVRPSKRVGGLLLGLPLLSVSALAWSAANIFTGVIFALVGLALIGIALRLLPNEPVQIAPLWVVGAGAVMFTFGWVYPHFLETTSLLPYLYSAPTGLVPCPTLSIVIGLALMVGGLDSRMWSAVLGGTGIFYGVFGALRLGVSIDYVLLIGALLSLLITFVPKRAVQEHTLAH
jgi:hypothetical protein